MSLTHIYPLRPCMRQLPQITFKPDLSRFGMTHLEEGSVALLRKRVYDMAGVLGKHVKVPPRSAC